MNSFMPAVSVPLNQFERVKSTRGIARLLSPGPAFGLHSFSSLERRQVEQYVFDQFQLNHGATVRDFLPLLLTTSCNDRYTATAGIRPAWGNKLFLEQYLPETVEQALGTVAGQCIEREHVVEIGNLAATRRGSSHLLFLILAAVLQRAGFEWLVCTATPQVQKTIRHLGLELYALGDADPSVLDADSLNGWGSYYESQPSVVAGNLSEAMAVLAKRQIYTRLISFYQNRIDALALMIKQRSNLASVK